MVTNGSASAASETEVGSIYPTTQELRAAAAKEADTYHVKLVSVSYTHLTLPTIYSV